MLALLRDGGIWMVPLVFFSIISIGVVLDRAFAFMSYAKVDNRSLRAKVMELLWSDRIEEAALYCSKTPGPIAAVLLAGLQTFDKHRDRANATTPLTMTVKEAMDDYTVHAISAVEKRFAVLSTVGNAAPLVGMLGTVSGMISSFGELSSNADTAAVAAGISEALITTASGLVVALLAVIPYNYFMSKSDAIDLEIEEVKSQFVDTIASAYEGQD